MLEKIISFFTKQKKPQAPVQPTSVVEGETALVSEVKGILEEDAIHVLDDGKLDLQDVKVVGKHILESKTVWINLVAILAFFAQSKLGFAIGPDLQMQILGVINIILRGITKEPVRWS